MRKVTFSGQGSETVKFTAPRNYVKVGARLGWRIDFGRPGGDVQDIHEIDEMFSIIESYVFVGVPRFSLAFGWRF